MKAEMDKEASKGIDILYSYFTKEENCLNSGISESMANQLLVKPEKECKIIKEIGRGATGVVYKVVQAETKNKYAMKVIPVHHLTKSQQTQKLKEVLLMKGLEHPNIIHYIASYIEDDELCIIMEHAMLGDLAYVFAKSNLLDN